MTPGHIETHYGHDILAHEVAELGSFVAVVDSVAWNLTNSSLPAEPRRVLVPSSLEQDELDQLAGTVRQGETVVGIGGGMAIDAAKYLALTAGCRPVLVPSITSSNAPFSDSISVRDHGQPSGMEVSGQPKQVIVDFALIGRADPRFNRAGFADLLAHQVALQDWRHAAKRAGLTINEDAYRVLARAMDECRAAASDVGKGNRRGVEFVMRMFERLTLLLSEYGGVPSGSGSEHLVAWNLEAVTGRYFIHGEAVALGIAVSCVVYGDDTLRCVLEEAGVRYRLGDLGVSWAELEQTLKTMDAYNRRVRGFDTVFSDLRWTDELLAAVQSAVGGRGELL